MSQCKQQVDGRMDEWIEWISRWGEVGAAYTANKYTKKNQQTTKQSNETEEKASKQTNKGAKSKQTTNH